MTTAHGLRAESQKSLHKAPVAKQTLGLRERRERRT